MIIVALTLIYKAYTIDYTFAKANSIKLSNIFASFHHCTLTSKTQHLSPRNPTSQFYNSQFVKRPQLLSKFGKSQSRDVHRKQRKVENLTREQTVTCTLSHDTYELLLLSFRR
jgi:hypothetical protein